MALLIYMASSCNLILQHWLRTSRYSYTYYVNLDGSERWNWLMPKKGLALQRNHVNFNDVRAENNLSTYLLPNECAASSNRDRLSQDILFDSIMFVKNSATQGLLLSSWLIFFLKFITKAKNRLLKSYELKRERHVLITIYLSQNR